MTPKLAAAIITGTIAQPVETISQIDGIACANHDHHAEQDKKRPHLDQRVFQERASASALDRLSSPSAVNIHTAKPAITNSSDSLMRPENPPTVARVTFR